MPPFYRKARFRGSRLKIERAGEHIREFQAYAVKVFSSEFAPFTVACEVNPETGKVLYKCCPTEEILHRFAAICGDAVHNLRTALDFAWYEVTARDTPAKQESKIKFPIFPTLEILEAFLDSHQEQKSVASIRQHLTQTIKPYRGSNVIGDALYHLNQLDIRDKHKLAIPHVQVSQIFDHPADNHLDGNVLSGDLMNSYGIKSKDQGSLSASIIFGEGTTVEGKVVLSTLKEFQTAVQITLLFLAELP